VQLAAYAGIVSTTSCVSAPRESGAASRRDVLRRRSVGLRPEWMTGPATVSDPMITNTRDGDRVVGARESAGLQWRRDLDQTSQKDRVRSVSFDRVAFTPAPRERCIQMRPLD
jgi:hypothetical protein